MSQSEPYGGILSRLRARIGLRTRLFFLWHRVPRGVWTVYWGYAAHPEAKHIIGPFDAAVLYREVRKHRPRHIVELGCGLGTASAIMALAMEANAIGRVTALEQLDWMADLAQGLLPASCRQRVEILCRDPEVREYYGEEWSCYRFTPTAADIDYVIVDGPAPWEDAQGNLIQRPNGDLIGLLPYLSPGCRVFIDGRSSTVEGYRRHLGHHFRIRTARRLRQTLMEMIEPPRESPLPGIGSRGL